MGSVLSSDEAISELQRAFEQRITQGVKSLERNRFELSYATRLNRAVGLYFGWRP
jgi:hypothetical protein